jgi:hypothetical protein
MFVAVRTPKTFSDTEKPKHRAPENSLRPLTGIF